MVYTKKFNQSMPLPVEPSVISVYVPNSAAETNILVDVPWDNCELVYATSTVVTAIDGDGAMEIDLQLDSTTGTEMMSITVALSSAVGDQDEATVSSASACRNLTSASNINIEVDGSSTGTGAVMLFLYFERTQMI